MSLLFVEERAEGLRLFLGEPGSLQPGPTTSGPLETTLGAAIRGLERKPRKAYLLTDRVRPLCLDLPPLSNARRQEVESLVRFELEPHLDGEPGSSVVGWAEARASSEAGPVLTCGTSAGERDHLAETFRAAGCPLVAIYPRLGCASALAAPETATLVESSGDQIAVTQLSEGAVVRLRVFRAATALRAAEEALELLAPPLTAVGAFSPEVLETLRLGDPQLRELHPDFPGSVAGALVHATRGPGGERVASVSAKPPRPSLFSRPELRWAAAFVVVLGILFGADLGLRALRDERQETLRQRQATLAQARAREDARQALQAKRDALLGRVEPLREVVRAQGERQARARRLSQLLSALAEAPGVALDRCEDLDEAVQVEGQAGSSAEAEEYLSALGRALAARGLTLTQREISRDEFAFRFSGAFTRVAEREQAK